MLWHSWLQKLLPGSAHSSKSLMCMCVCVVYIQYNKHSCVNMHIACVLWQHSQGRTSLRSFRKFYTNTGTSQALYRSLKVSCSFWPECTNYTIPIRGESLVSHRPRCSLCIIAATAGCKIERPGYRLYTTLTNSLESGLKSSQIRASIAAISVVVYRGDIPRCVHVVRSFTITDFLKFECLGV